MSVSDVEDPGGVSAVGDVDLFWHRKAYGQAIVQWDRREVIDLVTRHTRGRLAFSTVADLAFLTGVHEEVRTGWASVVRGFSGPLEAAVNLRGSVARVAREVGMDLEVLEHAAAMGPAESAGLAVDVREALRRIPIRTPLVEIWEIKQVAALWDAAAMVIEDVIGDLVLELVDEGRGWGELAVVTGARDAGSLVAQLERWLVKRGGPGDPRRRAYQVF